MLGLLLCFRCVVQIRRVFEWLGSRHSDRVKANTNQKGVGGRGRRRRLNSRRGCRSFFLRSLKGTIFEVPLSTPFSVPRLFSSVIEFETGQRLVVWTGGFARCEILNDFGRNFGVSEIEPTKSTKLETSRVRQFAEGICAGQTACFHVHLGPPVVAGPLDVRLAAAVPDVGGDLIFEDLGTTAKTLGHLLNLSPKYKNGGRGRETPDEPVPRGAPDFRAGLFLRLGPHSAFRT